MKGCELLDSGRNGRRDILTGSLRRLFSCFPPDAVSEHRRSAQALLTLASTSAQVTQSRSCACKVVNSTLYTTMFRGPSQLLGNLNRTPPPNIHCLITR